MECCKSLIWVEGDNCFDGGGKVGSEGDRDRVGCALESTNGLGHCDRNGERNALFRETGNSARPECTGRRNPVAWSNNSGDGEEDAVDFGVMFELRDIFKDNFDSYPRWDVAELCFEDLRCLLFEETCNETLTYGGVIDDLRLTPGFYNASDDF